MNTIFVILISVFALKCYLIWWCNKEPKKHNLDLEMFCDECYYHMIAVKPKKHRDFSTTLHFDTEIEAKDFIESIPITCNTWDDVLEYAEKYEG